MPCQVNETCFRNCLSYYAGLKWDCLARLAELKSGHERHHNATTQNGSTLTHTEKDNARLWHNYVLNMETV